MPLPGTYSGQQLENELELSNGERELWGNAQSTTVHAVILLSKNIQRFSKSNDQYANAMKWLTAGILFVGVLQFLIPLINALVDSGQ